MRDDKDGFSASNSTEGPDRLTASQGRVDLLEALGEVTWHEAHLEAKLLRLEHSVVAHRGGHRVRGRGDVKSKLFVRLLREARVEGRDALLVAECLHFIHLGVGGRGIGWVVAA